MELLGVLVDVSGGLVLNTVSLGVDLAVALGSELASVLVGIGTDIVFSIGTSLITSASSLAINLLLTGLSTGVGFALGAMFSYGGLPPPGTTETLPEITVDTQAPRHDFLVYLQDDPGLLWWEHYVYWDSVVVAGCLG